eukprot:g2559.t1
MLCRISSIIQSSIHRQSMDSPGGLDVFGIGQAMIDFGAVVSEDSLIDFHIKKGGRRLISIQERHQIRQTLGQEFDLRAGGSITNTLMALAQLSAANGRPLRLGCAGCIGSDVLGVFYASELARQGIKTIKKKKTDDSLTGCVVVLTTPDAQRSFLVYPGTGLFVLTQEMKQAIATSKMLLIEGYMLDVSSDTLLQIQEAIKIAKENGTLVVLTGGDAQVISNALDSFWNVIIHGVDLFLCNYSEALALLNKSSDSLTYGPNGSYIGTKGQVHWIDVLDSEDQLVDTCGAGDVYAAGILYGFLHRYGIYDMGFIASRSALSIISKTGAQLTQEESNRIIKDVKQTQLKPSIREAFNALRKGVKQEA